MAGHAEADIRACIEQLRVMQASLQSLEDERLALWKCARQAGISEEAVAGKLHSIHAGRMLLEHPTDAQPLHLEQVVATPGILGSIAGFAGLAFPGAMARLSADLHATTESAFGNIFTNLFAAGVDIDHDMKNGKTPLGTAAAQGQESAVRLLLDAGGADIDGVDSKTNRTPLFLAAQGGHVDVVRLLLSRGADKNKANRYGATPLLKAAEEGHVETVWLLLHAGADFEKASDTDGSTPLLIAASGGHAEVVKRLLERGADKDRAKRNGQTALSAAKLGGHEKVIRTLEAAGGFCVRRHSQAGLAVVSAYNHSPILAPTWRG